MRSDGMVWKQVWKSGRRRRRRRRHCLRGWVWRGFSLSRGCEVSDVAAPLHFSAALLFTLPDARPLNTAAFSEHARARHDA